VASHECHQIDAQRNQPVEQGILGRSANSAGREDGRRSHSRNRARKVAAESRRGIGSFFQTSIYDAAADAAFAKQRFLRQHSRKGGQAKKSDTLQTLIEQIVQSNLALSLPELIAKLSEHKGIEPIQDFAEGTIFFTTDDGRTKEAKVSGLKDRLSRAKKKIRSR
jgi:hypothetical protein